MIIVPVLKPCIVIKLICLYVDTLKYIDLDVRENVYTCVCLHVYTYIHMYIYIFYTNFHNIPKASCFQSFNFNDVF